jgi:gliding motility-associated-like protein
MTLPKTLVIACSFLLLFQYVNGQDVKPLIGADETPVNQALSIESEAADSTSGQPVIANVFTPNGDGINDYIEFPGDGSKVYEFSVFTRTGTQVFHSSSKRIFWDGTNSAGIELKEGVYYYVLEEEEDSELDLSTGFIYLFR